MKKLAMYVTFATLLASGAAVAQTSNITLEDIWTRHTFAPRGIGGIRSMADGEHYLSMSRTGREIQPARLAQDFRQRCRTSR